MENQAGNVGRAEAGDALREFGSVILTIDHTSHRSDGHRVQKMVLSTEDLIETMLSLFAYYDNDGLFASKATIQQFQQAAQCAFPCFAYRTSENIQIVMAEATFAALLVTNKTMLGAVETILNTVGQSLQMVDQQRGGPVPLTLLAFDSREPDADDHDQAEVPSSLDTQD